MISDDPRDQTIRQLETELAEIQSEGAYVQLAAKIERNKLRETLHHLVNAVNHITAGFDANVQRMTNDLTGGERK